MIEINSKTVSKWDMEYFRFLFSPMKDKKDDYHKCVQLLYNDPEEGLVFFSPHRLHRWKPSKLPIELAEKYYRVIIFKKNTIILEPEECKEKDIPYWRENALDSAWKSRLEQFSLLSDVRYKVCEIMKHGCINYKYIEDLTPGYAFTNAAFFTYGGYEPSGLLVWGEEVEALIMGLNYQEA